MHRQFKKLLRSAGGNSEQIISVFIDIRGFSKFSQSTESPDTAMFIKRAFINILDVYFPYAKYFKSTGDGLLLIFPFSEKRLQDVANKVILSAINCHGNFGRICTGDPMINFETPNMVGFGIARGTACRLEARGQILDYSGRLLNLSARLMNLARPSGIVIDGDFKLELLEKGLAEKFEEKFAYLRGIAEDIPRTIYALRDHVEIPYEALSPIRGSAWGEHKWEYSLSRLKQIPHTLSLDIDGSSRDSKDDFIEVSYPTYVDGSKNGWRDVSSLHDEWTIVVKGDRKQIVWKVPKLVERLTRAGVPDEEKISLVFKWKK